MIPSSPPVPPNSGTPRGGVALYGRRRKLDEMIKEGGLGDVYAVAQKQIETRYGSSNLYTSRAEQPLHIGITLYSGDGTRIY